MALAARFERLVDRSGEHHVWTGAIRPGVGTGRVKVDGRELAAHRVAWELAHGPLSETARLLPCPDEPACVRLDHLRIRTSGQPRAGVSTSNAKRAKGAGSLRNIRAGVWALEVSSGRFSDGSVRRHYRTVQAADSRAANRELAAFIEEIRSTPQPAGREMRDACRSRNSTNF